MTDKVKPKISTQDINYQHPTNMKPINLQNPVTHNASILSQSDPAQLPVPSDSLPSALEATTEPPSNTNLDLVTKSKIESLKRKQRADSFFNSLTDEQAEKVFHWMNTIENVCEIQDLITAPPPKGLGLEVCMQTLRRIRAHINAMSVVVKTNGLLDAVYDVEERTDLTQSARILNTISHLLQDKAFELANTIPGSPIVTQLVRDIHRLADIDFQRQKLLLEREKLLRQNNAGTSPRHHPTQHHRVDLNIVPPKPPVGDPAIVVSADPQVDPAAGHKPPQQLPPPNP